MASLIHPSSCEGVKSELDLFAVPPTQTSLEHGHYVEHRPQSIISEGPVEFVVSEEGDYYIDLANTFLYVRASIVKANGTTITAQSNVAPVSNWLHSLWSQVDLSLNNTLVTQSNNTYPYRAYIESLLSFGKEAKESQLLSNLWIKDTAEAFDTNAAGNVGFTKRKAAAAGSHEIDMFGKLHLDMCFQNRYLLNGIEIKLRLIRSKKEFCLQGVGDYKITLKDVGLYCRKVKHSDAVRLAHAKALQLGTAKYPLRRVEVKTFTIPQGNLTSTKENLFLGQLPKRVVVGCIDNDAFNGSLAKNPFNFKHNDINFLALYKDGEQIPSLPFQPNFTNKQFIRSYLSLFVETGQYYSDEGNDLTRSEYAGGNTLFAFDLTPDLGSCGNNFELIKNGNLRLEIHFATALPRTVNVVVYGEFDNLLQIDKSRNVIFDYTA